ncbi:MAG: hypothetical protein ACK53Y_00005, partial [bacterium]
MTQPANISHPFQSLWQNAKYYGLTPMSEWDKIATTIRVSDMHGYLRYFLQCPHIADSLMLQYDTIVNTIGYTWICEPTIADVEVISHKATGLYNKFLDLTYTFQYRYTNFNQKMDEIATNISYYHEKVTSSMHRGSALLVKQASQHTEQFQQFMEQQQGHILDVINNTTKTSLTQLHNTIDKMTKESVEKIEQQVQDQYQSVKNQISQLVTEATTNVT